MKIKKESSRRFFVGGFIFLLNINLFAAIENKSDWDAAFKAYFGETEPMLSETDANEEGDYSWRAHYWIRAYVTMASTYGDATYLDKAVRLIDFIFYNWDDARYARGELDLQNEPYISAPLQFLKNRNDAAPGWRTQVFGEEWRIQTLDDGQITHAIMRFVDLVYSNRKFVAYRQQADQYLKKIEETVAAHNSLFALNRFEDIPGSYYYPNPNGSGLYTGAVPFNHSATMGTTLLLLDKVKGGVPEYRQKAAAILEYFKRHVRLTENNAYEWDYHPQDPSKLGVEDFNHAHVDLSFLILAYHRGLNLTSEDMQRFATTLTKNVYLGDGELAWTIDGKQIGTTKNYWPIGFDWIDLAEFDPYILQIAREVYQKYYTVPTWSRPFLGWAEILRWAQVLDGEIDLEPPSPPKLLIVIIK